MNCAKKIQIDNVIYTANTSFKIGIRCNEIALDPTIGELERALGIICTVFGKNSLKNQKHYEKLFMWAQNWLSCGKEVKKAEKDPDMDFVQDYDYIVASFQSDYGIDLDKSEIDWNRFITLINGLSNSELGNCCILNRIRNLRNLDVSQIKDLKRQQKAAELQKQFALKKSEKETHLTKQQQKSVDEFYKSLGY